jgi:hypothetical protein
MASAIRAASAACHQRFDRAARWKAAVDSFVRYGDPTLQLMLRVPPKRAADRPSEALRDLSSRHSVRNFNRRPKRNPCPAPCLYRAPLRHASLRVGRMRTEHLLRQQANQSRQRKGGQQRRERLEQSSELLEVRIVESLLRQRRLRSMRLGTVPED